MGKTIPLTSLLEQVGQRVRSAREKTHLSQEDAAHRAGIDPRRWQRMEQGTVNLTVKTLARVAEALDLSFWDLLHR